MDAPLRKPSRQKDEDLYSLPHLRAAFPFPMVTVANVEYGLLSFQHFPTVLFAADYQAEDTRVLWCVYKCQVLMKVEYRPVRAATPYSDSKSKHSKILCDNRFMDAAALIG